MSPRLPRLVSIEVPYLLTCNEAVREDMRRTVHVDVVAAELDRRLTLELVAPGDLLNTSSGATLSSNPGHGEVVHKKSAAASPNAPVADFAGGDGEASSTSRPGETG